MKIAASDLRPTDRIRGIGLLVDQVVEPSSSDLSEFVHVHGRYADSDDGPFVLLLPASHLVNVARPFQVGDRVLVPGFGATVEATVKEVLPDERLIRHTLPDVPAQVSGFTLFEDARHLVGA